MICSTKAASDRGKMNEYFVPFPRSRRNNKVLEQESWLVTYNRAFQIDRARIRASTFAGHENEFARFFVRGDERAEKICWNPSTAPANARRSPGDCFAQNVFTVENRGEARRQRERQLSPCRSRSAGPLSFFQASQIFAFMARKIFGAK